MEIVSAGLQNGSGRKLQRAGGVTNKRPQRRACRVSAQAVQQERASAIVRENKAESVDGSLRSITLCVHEPDSTLERRWFDAFVNPGQKIRLMQPGVAEGIRIPIASSPYEVRTNSIDLAASIVTVFADSSDRFVMPGKTHHLELVSAEPGDELEVSPTPVEEGYAPVIANASVPDALDAEYPLLFIALNTDGIAAARSALEWPSVQAFADTHPVTLLYLAPSSASACKHLFDNWRRAGIVVDFVPTHAEEDVPASSSNEEADRVSLLSHLVSLESGSRFREYLRADPKDLCCLLSGCNGELGARVSRTLRSDMRVSSERILFC